MSSNPNAEIHATGLGWFLDKFVSPFVDGIADRAQREKWKRFDWPKAEARYRERIKQRCGSLLILGRGEAKLTDVFTDVNVLDERSALHDYGEDQLLDTARARPFFRQPGQRVPGIVKVKSRDNLYILGKPGAGKTTFLKYVATQAADYRLVGERLPIFVSLHEWSISQHGKGKNPALLPYIVDEFALCDFPDAAPFVEYMLEKGKAIVLFDGLDEVQQADEHRQELTQLLKNFAFQYEETQVLLTCRIAAERYRFEGFQYVEVADFTTEQIKAYARKWFERDDRSRQHRGVTYETFEEELEKTDNQSILELCSNPLLLSMLCFDFARQGEFARTRADLYDGALNALLSEWYAERGIRTRGDTGIGEDAQFFDKLSARRKKQMFAAIAYESFNEGKLVFEQHWVERRLAQRIAKLRGDRDEADIDATAVLKRIESQTGILVERARRRYSFAHLTFHEYFTAYWINEDKKEGLVEQMAREHLLDDEWREVFLLTASLLEDGDELIAAMRKRTDALVRDDKGLMQLLTWASDKAANVPEARRPAALLAYLIRALSRALSYVRELSFLLLNTNALMHAFTLVCDFSLALESARSLAHFQEKERNYFFMNSPGQISHRRDLERARTRFHDLAYVRKSARDVARAQESLREITRDVNQSVGIDFGLLYAWQLAAIYGLTDNMRRYATGYANSFPELIGISKRVKQPSLTAALSALQPPTSDASTTAWQHFADALFDIMRRERDLVHDWQFSEEQIERLNDWFRANELLVHCLDEASVTDKQAVRSRLLQPPSRESK